MLSEKLQETDRFYEKTVRTTLCIVKCKKTVFGSRMDRVVDGNVEEDFDMRKPYDYLQLCYFKVAVGGELFSFAFLIKTILHSACIQIFQALIS